MSKESVLVNSCNMMSAKPIVMALPYPPQQVQAKNQAYANLLSIDYCGSVSELSAITQYINFESRLSGVKCQVAQVILGIAMAEMMHLQKLGELIVLLGGKLDYSARLQNGKRAPWTPEYLALPDHGRQMVQAGIASEKEAIKQYRMHIKMIQDPCIRAVLARIIQDEEYHILTLNALLAS